MSEEKKANFVQVLDENGNPPIQPEVIMTTNEGITEEQFLNDPENKAGALALASVFYDLMGKKWFTVEKLCQKAKIDHQQAFQKLQMCKLFGTVDARIGNSSDSREQLRQPLFKVTISLEDKISAIDGIIKYHEEALVDIKMQRKILVTQLEDSKPKESSL